jgi:hypothetical protein
MQGRAAPLRWGSSRRLGKSLRHDGAMRRQYLRGNPLRHSFQAEPDRDGHWKHSVLYAFPNPGDGSFPTGGVIVDKAGNLYADKAVNLVGCKSPHHQLPGTE